MARLFLSSIAAAALVASSSPLVEAIGQWPPAEVPVTAADISRLDSSLVDSKAYASDVTMRVCYSEISSLRQYIYTGNTYFYRLKACEVSTVAAPKCSTTQLAACTPAFYTVGISDRTTDGRIVNVRKDTDQGTTGLGDYAQGANSTDTPTSGAPTSAVPTTAPTPAKNSTASNNTEAGTITTPTSAVPASTPKQSGAVHVGISLASVVATVAVGLASL